MAWRTASVISYSPRADFGIARAAGKIAGVHSQQFMEITASEPRRRTVASSGFSTSSARLPLASAVASANAAIRSAGMLELASIPSRVKPTSAEPGTSLSRASASVG